MKIPDPGNPSSKTKMLATVLSSLSVPHHGEHVSSVFSGVDPGAPITQCDSVSGATDSG